MRYLRFTLAFAFLFIGTISTIAQTGPGGVGNATGSGGQPRNVIWLDANTLGLVDNANVANWADKSGNSYTFVASSSGNLPSFESDGASTINGFPVVRFDDTNAERLVINPITGFPTAAITTLIVFKTTHNTEGIVSYAVTGSDNEYLLFDASAIRTYVNGAIQTGGAFSGAPPNILLSRWTSTGGNTDHFRNGLQVSTGTISNGTAMSDGGSLTLGGEQDAVDGGYDATQDFGGDIAEIIIYNSYLNNAQRTLVENYLAQKYGIALNVATTDAYGNGGNFNAAYIYSVGGVGKTGVVHSEGGSNGFYVNVKSPVGLADGDYIMAGHNNGGKASSTSDLTGTTPNITDRWERDWYLEKTSVSTFGSNIYLEFDFPEGITGGQYPQDLTNYYLLYRATASGNYSVAAVTAKSKIDDRIRFELTETQLANGYYSIGTSDNSLSSIAGGPAKTWYSYQSGDWTDPNSWTLDGGLIPLLVNPFNDIPSSTDNVVVTSGRTITMNTNNTIVLSMEVIGTLDMAATTGHNFTAINGAGRIKISGATDNFPAGATTNFVDPTVGGTVELNGAGISLNTNRTFNNLEINMAASGNIATLISNYTLNGNLTITNGLFQFNNTTTANRNFTVNGNVVVQSAGGIRVGVSATSTRHEFNLYGDFTNDGTAYFTQRTSATTGSEATDGIVDVNMLSPSRDQQIICNGVTRFYRIEINKGTNDTYKATISASAIANFNLFGYANEAHGNTAQLATNDNALGLIYGTVEIGSNADIPVLNTGTNYNISEGSQLWVNGGSVTKSSGTAIVPYGKVKVSSGTLSATVGSGLTLRDNGSIEISGGTVVAGSIRTSNNGAGAIGSYIQTGGSVTLTGTGSNPNNDYSVFSLTYPGNVFRMSGGTLSVQNRSNLGAGSARGAIFINSDPANVSVTGGTIIMTVISGTNYRVTSRAAFWNVIMRPSSAGGTRNVHLLGTTSGVGTFGVDELSLAIQPLMVMNDFTIESPVNFTTNSADVTISGNFEIQNGGTYTHGTNTTTIIGSGVSSLVFGNAATQTFNNLTINKTTASNEVVITTGNATAMRVNGALTVAKGIFDYATFIVSVRGDVTLASGVTVGKSTSTGRLLVDGTTSQTLSSSSAAIYSMELNNATTPTTALTLTTGNLTINRTLTLTNGVFIIGANKLTLNGATASISGTGFSATKMIQASGLSSDAGLELYLDANESLVYPIGVSGKYTPVTASFTSFSDDGLIRIVPVNGVLQTTNLSGGASILGFYWRVSHSNFTTLPLVRYVYTYVQSDVAGTESTYVPGKVLDVNPFTRSFENDVNKVDDAANTITFNGSGSGFTLDIASYTAGQSGRFTGTPRIFYLRSNGFWDQNNTWSFTRGGANAGATPGPGDIAILRRLSVSYSGIVTVRNPETVAKVIFDDENGFSSGCPRIIFNTGTPYTSNLGTIEVASTHQGGTLNGTTHGAVIQYNVDNAYAGAFPGGDFGNFNNYLNALVIYSWQSNNGTITLSSSATEYPQLWFEGGNNSRYINFPNVDVTVRGRAYITGNFAAIRVSGGATPVTLNFQKELYIGSGCCGDGTFQFQGAGSANQTVQVDGDIVFTTGGSRVINILSPGSGTLSHKLIAKGDINVVTGATLNLGSGSASETNVILELQGTTSNAFTNTGTSTLSRIVMNKGTDISNSFTFQDSFTLTGATNTATKAVTLQNGLLIFNDPAINVVLTSGGGNFNIPGTAGLEVRAGTVSTTTTNTNANITLDGLLRISGGTATIDAGAGFPNYIEYSNTGNATIEITGGTLTVGGAIRRGLSSTTGVLKYTQSNGTVVIGNRGAPTTSRGVFEVVNTGSQFNHSGGSFTIVQGINSTTVPSLWLEPASSSITSGSTITIGNANTPAGVNSQNIGIKSLVSLNNLTIAGSNSPIVKIYTSPLTVSSILTISNATTLNANSQNLNIGGNFIVDGTYVPTSNTTSFTNTGAASISGTAPTLSFYNMNKSGGGALTLAKEITVNQDLQVLAGTLATSTFTLNLKRHARIDATTTSASGVGLAFNGTAQQQLTRTSSGTGTLGIVTVNNTAGVVIPDGNGYNFNITSGLRLQQGVFDIGGGLLFLGTNAFITPVNPYSITNMIQTNSSFTDFGVRKQFPLNYTTDFTFPVGQLAYTPVRFNFGSPGNTTGTSGTPVITVRPANERHPVIVDDDEDPVGAGPEDFDDLQNVLQYHWLVNADNVAASFSATMDLTYEQSLVRVTAPRTEADYIAARILSDSNPTELINKFTTTDVDETTNIISFPFSGVTDVGISGEYFAGVELAIPDNVPIYTTNTSGDANTAVYTPAVPGGGIPTGAKVIISSGDNLNFPGTVDNASFYKTEILANGTVTVTSGSIGHRFGIVTGTGTLRIESNTTSAVLPAAIYDDFFSCAGGSLTYAGTGSYEILGGITALRNLTLEGSGLKTLGNNDITICNDFTVNAGIFNSNNRTITVLNDVLLSGGTINTQLGTLLITRDFTQSSGVFNGGTGGSKVIGRNLSINTGTFTSGSGTNTIRVNGSMTVAGAATFTGGTSSSSGLRYLFQGSSLQTLTGNFTGTRFINRLEINNSGGLVLAGNVDIERELILTSGNITPGINSLVMNSNAVATPIVGRSNSFVSGKLYKVVPTTDGFTFPIGKAGIWRSGSVSNLSVAGDTWDMEYFYAPATNEAAVTNLTPVAPILRIAAGEYWKVSNGVAVGRTAVVGLSWGFESDVSTISSEREAMQVVRWNTGMTRWDNYGGTNFNAGHTQTLGTFNSGTTLPFTQNIVTLGSTEIANPLPVTLVKFEGRVAGSVAKLNWVTASELNNDYFEIQRSSNGLSFVTLAKVDGKGTTNELSNYNFEDNAMLTGKNYYRLRQVDFNGQFEYSQTILLEYDATNPFYYSVYPNPTTTNNINLEFFNYTESDIRIRLFDATGHILFESIKDATEMSNEIVLDTRQSLKQGLYFIEVFHGGKRVTKRVVIID